jgi:hypothetical protein
MTSVSGHMTSVSGHMISVSRFRGGLQGRLGRLAGEAYKGDLQGRLARGACKGGSQGMLAKVLAREVCGESSQRRLARGACRGGLQGRRARAREVCTGHPLQSSFASLFASLPCNPPLQTSLASLPWKPPLQTSLASFPCKPPLQTSLANVPCKPPLRALLASPAFIPWDFARALATETERVLVLPLIIARLRLIRQIGRPLQLRFLHLGRGCGQAPSWTAASRR